MEKTGPLPDDWWREEPLEKKIGKKIILHPGSRGGQGYWDTTGHWQYGEHPVVQIPRITLKDSAERAITAEEHLLDALNDLGFLDNRQLVAQPVHTEIVVRKHMAQAMAQRGYDSQEFKTAWDAVMAHLHVASGYKAIKWNKDTIDGRIQAWLSNRKVANNNLDSAIANMPKEMWHQMAEDVANDVPVFSWSKEEGEAEKVKVRKQTLERIMELRYYLNYQETPDEGPPPYQNALPGTENFNANDYSGMDRARAFHEAVSATDRFEDVPHHLLALALAMDPEVGPLLSMVNGKGRRLLEPFYKHNVNLLNAQNLAAVAQSDTFGNPLEMKMLWAMLEQKGDLSEGGDILTAKDIKDYLEDKYGYKPLSADLRHEHSAWENVSEALKRANLNDLAEAIDEAWRKPSAVPSPVGQFPMSADIEPGDKEAGEELFNDFNQEIGDLDYEGGGASDEDIDEQAEAYFDNHYHEAVNDLAADYKRENPDEYATILDRLAEQYAFDNYNFDTYVEQAGGDEDKARAQMLSDAQEEVEDLAQDEFDEHAREMVEDDATEQAQESAHEAAVEYYNEYGNGTGDDLEERVKAKIDIMNTLGPIMRDRHGVTPDACRAFFRTIHGEPDDEHTANAVDLHEYIAGATSHLIECWAGSSDGHNAVSNAMQILVSDIFPDVPRWDEKPEHMDESAFDQGREYVGNPQFRAVAEPFLRAMYEHTQQRFKDANVTHVVISRGIKDGHGDEIQSAIDAGIIAFGNDTENQGQGGFITGTHPIIDNPMSSWSWSPSTSEGFASRQSVVFAAKVPIERVIGTFRTGYGCMDEEEAVVLGGGGLARWYYTHGSGSGSRDNRPNLVERALAGDPLTVEAVQVSDYNDYKMKSIYKPGRIYDANQGKMVEGVLPEHLVSHNKAAVEFNEKYNQKKVDAAVKAEQIMSDVGVDLLKHPGMKTYLSNVLHQVTDDNQAYYHQTMSSLTGHGATMEQAGKLYDHILSQTKNDTVPETQIHQIAVHGGGLPIAKAEQIYAYLTHFRNAPSSVQNNEGYVKQHVEGMIKQFAIGGFQASAIIEHIQATPGMYKDNDYTPTLEVTAPTTPKAPKIPKTDSSGQVVHKAPESKTLSPESKISLFMASGGLSKVSAEAAHQALKTFMASDPAKQQDKSYQNHQIAGLIQYEGLTKYQATQIVSLIKDKPELFKSAAVEGSSRLQKALAWTADLARRLGH